MQALLIAVGAIVTASFLTINVDQRSAPTNTFTKLVEHRYQDYDRTIFCHGNKCNVLYYLEGTGYMDRFMRKGDTYVWKEVLVSGDTGLYLVNSKGSTKL